MTAAPQIAEAKPTVIVEKFDGGRKARPFYKDVVTMMKKAGFEIVDDADDADAVVTGKVKRHRGKWAVRLEVRDYSGEVVALVEMKLRKRGFTKKRTFRRVGRKLKAGVKEAKENADSVREATEDEDEDVDNEDDDEESEDNGKDDDEERSPERDTSSGSGMNMTGRLGAGVSFVGRDLAIGSTGDDVASYDGIYAPGVRIDAELTFKGKYVVEAYVDRAVGLKSGLAGAGDTPLATTQSRFGGAGYYRLSFGSENKAYIQLGAGAGQMEFSIAEPQGMTIEVPDVIYTYAEPAAAASVPVTPKVSAVAKAGVLLVLSAGEVVDADHYGSASMVGYDALVGADIAFRPNLGVRAGISYTRVNLEFNGDGQMTASAGATDTFAGAFVTGAYSF